MTPRAALRKKNQITLPERVARHLGAAPGDQLIFIPDDEPGTVRVRRLRDSYAGIAAGLYGRGDEEVARYVETERASWER